jgi:nucleotide-binding universal stress UspA family protein
MQVDFVIMGVTGQDGKTIGSVTESVMQAARCTAMAIKNPFYAVGANYKGARAV